MQTTLVSVPVIVTDDQGRYLPDLHAGDFALYEDGQPRSIDVFSTSREPLSVALLLDTSRSTATVLSQIKKAAADFVSKLRRTDQALVLSFDFEVNRLSRLTEDPDRLKDAVKSAELADYPDTRLRDAVFEAVQRNLNDVQGRKAVVLLSDGHDVGSTVSAAELAEAVAAGGAAIYPIHYRVDPREVMKKLFGVSVPLTGRIMKDDPTFRKYEREGEDYLRSLAEETGGLLYSSEPGDLKETFGRITDELRNQYLLGFYPREEKLDDRRHTLKVTVARPGATVRSRSSYRASKPGGTGEIRHR